MKFSYKMPPGVKSVRYEPNTHFVELTDKEGHTLHLPAHGVMAHKCGECSFVWWTGSNRCSFCPSCASPKVEKVWGKMQVAFVPEEESKFSPPTPSLMPVVDDDKTPVPSEPEPA